MLIQFAAIGAVLPFVTLWLRDRGLVYSEISFILLACSAVMLVFPFLWGMLADRFVPLNRLFIVINLCGAGTLMFMLPQHTFVGLAVSFTCYSACMIPGFSLTNALSFHHLARPREQFGRLRAWGSVGWILPFLPIALWTALQPAAGLDFTLYLGIGLCGVMAVYSFWLPHTAPKARRTGTGAAAGPVYLPAVKRLVRDWNYLTVLLAMFLVSGSFTLLMYFSPPFLEDLGVSRPWIGPIQAIGVLAEVALFQIQPALIRRWNYTTVILTGCAALVLRHLLFVGVSNPWVLSASYLLAGVVIVFFNMGISVLVNAMAVAEVRATAQTLLAFFGLGLGPMFANWIAGRLAAHYANNLRPVFLFAAVLAALAAVLIAVRGRQLNRAGHVDA